MALFLPAASAQSITSPVSPLAGAASPPAATEDRIYPLDVTVNGAKGGTWVFIERNGVLFAPREAFDEWRVHVREDIRPIDFKGEPYWPLTAVPGFRSKVDLATQSVALYFDPGAFTALRLARELVKRPPVSPPLPAVFLNYDVNYTGTVLRGAPVVNDFGVLTEAGASTPWGTLTSTQVARRVTSGVDDTTERPLLRLETTLTHDFPETNRTLRIGDASTRAGIWGRNVYFGGVQFGTNFALTPGFISQPVPSLRGLSVAPSTVELYVNDVLRQVSSVPTGPFAIDNFPSVNGSGEARIVVRDLLGRETVVVQPFFANSMLLARELNDWSVEAGKVRRGLGELSDSYGESFASGTWRRGMTDHLTLEVRGEATPGLRTAGVGAITALPLQFLGTVAVAGSDQSGTGRGWSWLVGLDRTGLKSSLSIQAQGASTRFRMLGQDNDFPVNKLQVAGSWTWYTERNGAFGLGFAKIEPFGQAAVTTVSANYSVALFERASLNVSVSRASGAAAGTSAGATLTIPLESARTFSASATHHAGFDDFYVSESRSPTADNPLGWRTLAGTQDRKAQLEGGLYYLGNRGTMSGEVSASPDRTAVRAGVTGGLVAADGRLFTTRRMDQSFAVVELPGYPDVGVGIGSNVMAKTDADGVAIIPNLWPYQRNSVRLDPKDLPVSAELDSIEIGAVPAWRSGVLVKFPVRGGRGALMRIVFDDGQPAPPGATVGIEGDKESFYVARRGEAYVTGLENHNRLHLDWQGKRCRFEVDLPPPARDEVPRLGPFECYGVAR
ncbi:MAG TPA: fimbria/pilus outer membrane usher protein [Usitatibacter sp.]|nr:fimbria/pilus outer membrane usher protein [Usitatibacter sp.]